MTTVNSLTVFLLIGNLQIEITADFWENLGIQYWSIESDYRLECSCLWVDSQPLYPLIGGRNAKSDNVIW